MESNFRRASSVRPSFSSPLGEVYDGKMQFQSNGPPVQFALLEPEACIRVTGAQGSIILDIPIQIHCEVRVQCIRNR